MGAKRAVAGRSLPYDMLLAAYQKKNQAKQQSKFSPEAIGTQAWHGMTLTSACRSSAGRERTTRGG